MSKSSGVVATRIVLAVLLLSLIFSCVYFFIIKARNDAADADNEVFATYNSTISSENITSINRNLGNLESGSYYDYSRTNNIVGFREAYLSLHMSKQLLDSNSFRLISSHGDINPIQNKLKEIDDSAKVLLRSIIVYNTSKESYGSTPTTEQKAALIKNFEMIVNDLTSYSSLYADLANIVFTYTSKSYFDGVAPFSSAQYLYSYCLNKQIAVLDKAVTDAESNVDAEIYDESIAVSRKFAAVDAAHYQAQTTDTIVMSVISDCLNGVSFDELLTADNKGKYIKTITDDNKKMQATQMMIAIGLQGRIS